MKRQSMRMVPAAKMKMRLSTRSIVTSAALGVMIVSISVFFYLNVGASRNSLAGTAGVNITGIVNSYAQVTSIAGSGGPGSKILAITNVATCASCGPSPSSVTVTSEFGVGKKVFIIQMKGASINTTNTSSFGTITNPNNAGNYELATVSSITGTGPYTVTLSSGTKNPYTTSGMVQMVTVPQYTDMTIGVAGVTAMAWSRATGTGGIVAMEISNTLTLAGNVDVSGKGFAGGIPNAGTNATAAGSCINSITYMAASTLEYSQKGEGIYDYVAGSDYGRGALANGGGGGNTHNAGGGGGGNLGSGGKGGQGWVGAGACTSSITDGGGTGGNSLTYNPISNQIFMGGGGGGGQQNNGLASNGGNGGGIIFIRAATITASCSTTYGFYANGNNAANTGGNDGAGGGGAGGAIFLEENAYALSCQVNANANGGKGGTVTNADAHGGGGGGGVGVILVKTIPPAKANFASTQGAYGLDCLTCTLPSSTSSGSVTLSSTATSSSVAGSPCPGGNCFVSGWTASGMVTTLPIRLLSFTAESNEKGVTLEWLTAAEENNDFYSIERSTDAKNFEAIQRVKGAGNSNEKLSYQAIDKAPLNGTSYYRLRQTDFDGQSTVSKTASVTLNAAESEVFKIYPNPAMLGDNLTVELPAESFSITLLDKDGKLILIQPVEQGATSAQVALTSVTRGLYLVKVQIGNKEQVKRLLIH